MTDIHPGSSPRPDTDQRAARYTTTSIVVHYGDPAPTVRLANHLATFDTQVVVVANDRAARPPDLAAATQWLVPDRNLGYGQAFTLAARGRTSAALVLLNTDIVLSRATFDRCLDTLWDSPDVGVVGPVLRRADGSLQSGAARLSRWRRAPDVLVEPGDGVRECVWVTGAVMFVRREVAEGVGMDGSYFLGAEDADLCVRARRAGWRVVCRGDAPAIHHQSQIIAGPRWTYYSVRNRVWFARANFGALPALLNWLHAVLLMPRVVLADLVKRRAFTSSRLNLMALVHAWWRKPPAAAGPLPGEPLPARIMNW